MAERWPAAATDSNTQQHHQGRRPEVGAERRPAARADGQGRQPREGTGEARGEGAGLEVCKALTPDSFWSSVNSIGFNLISIPHIRGC